MLDTLISCHKVLIIDLGGFTADYVMMRWGKADLSACDSLENGTIVLYDNIRSKVNAEHNQLLDESDIDAILSGDTGYDAAVAATVDRETHAFVGDLLSALRERMLDLRTGKVVFVGGGSILLKRYIEASGKVGDVLVVDDLSANARGVRFPVPPGIQRQVSLWASKKTRAGMAYGSMPPTRHTGPSWICWTGKAQGGRRSLSQMPYSIMPIAMKCRTSCRLCRKAIFHWNRWNGRYWISLKSRVLPPWLPMAYRTHHRDMIFPVYHRTQYHNSICPRFPAPHWATNVGK
jgi:hypothetical protein